MANPTPPALKPPKADAAKCDLLGCGMLAVGSTDGTEVDSQGRKAIPNANFCFYHSNWPHSEDAKTFAATSGAYKGRK